MSRTGDEGMFLVKAKTICLRDRQMKDLEDYVRWFSPGRAWQQWDAPWEPVTPFDDDVSRRWLERLAEPPPTPRTLLEIETHNGRHIGWVNSYWVDEANRWRDCGIVIADEELWGQGLGREAFGLWVGYQIEAFDLPRIGMGTWSGNERMQRVAARVGMREEARFSDARLVEGKRYDAVRWGVTRTEWRRYRAPCEDGLRRFKPVDWEAAVELTRQLFDTHRRLQGAPAYSLQDARETLYAWVARRDTMLWVWQESGEIVGLARARFDGVPFFEEFVVAEDRRGQGIGSRFLSALEDERRDAGDRDVFLSMVWPGNRRAIDFYLRHGYELLNTFELRKGLDRDPWGSEITFLGRRFLLSENVPGDGDC